MTEITKKIGDLARDSDILVIGDTDHENKNLRDYLTSPELMGTLKDSGVKHVFIELPQELQHYADDLASGKITKEEYVQKMDEEMSMTTIDSSEERVHHGRVADMITYAAQNGMKVHFADNIGIEGLDPGMDGGVAFSDELSDAMDDFAEKAEKEGITANQENFEKYIKTLPPEEGEKLQKEVDHLNDCLRKRLERDGELAGGIADVAGNQKSAVIYGAMHDKMRAELEARGYKVGNIDIYPDSKWDKYKGNVFANGGYLKEDKVFSNDLVPQRGVEKYQNDKTIRSQLDDYRLDVSPKNTLQKLDETDLLDVYQRQKTSGLPSLEDLDKQENGKLNMDAIRRGGFGGGLIGNQAKQDLMINL